MPLGVFGRAASVTVIVPYLDGRIDGLLAGEQTEVERSGTGDALLRCGVNLFGAPAMDLAAFKDYRPRILLGASLPPPALRRCSSGE